MDFAMAIAVLVASVFAPGVANGIMSVSYTHLTASVNPYSIREAVVGSPIKNCAPKLMRIREPAQHWQATPLGIFGLLIEK